MAVNRRVLIVTGSYAPAMSPDMQRVRHLAWELPKCGWEVEVLSPDASFQMPSYIDGDSADFFPTKTNVHYVADLFPALKEIGIKSVGWRAIVPMLHAGWRLLRDKRFDLVYISTAQFPLFLLGPLWRKWLGVPFVLDFHDPLYKEDTFHPSWTTPSIKHLINNMIFRYLEAWTVTTAAGLVSVSMHYLDALRARYAKKVPPWLKLGRHAVIPFSVLLRDLEEAASGISANKDAIKSSRRIVYVGVGGPVMIRSFSFLCEALLKFRKHYPELANSVKIELYGTMLGWRDGEPKHLAEVAWARGLADVVVESPQRVSYRRSLEILLESDGALILGVDDAGYMPSKLFSYALSGKPLLASVRRDGPAFTEFQDCQGLGHVLWFGPSGDMPMADAEMVLNAFFQEVATSRNFDRRAMLEPWSAPAMARRHAELFDACLR